MEKQVSWKQKIKKLQIIFVMLLGLIYILYPYVESAYNDYKSKSQQLNQIQKKVGEKLDQLSGLQNKIELLKLVYSKKTTFINSYSDKGENYGCFIKYKFDSYNIGYDKGKKRFDDLKQCIGNQYKVLGGKYANIFDSLSNEDIEKIAISMGIDIWNNSKMQFNYKKVLASLDNNIFNKDMEKKVSVVTFATPVLLDAKRKLYKVSFTLSTMTDWKGFKEILSRLQNRIYRNNNLYYTLSSVSNFDLSDPSFVQNITIQGNFYFTK